MFVLGALVIFLLIKTEIVLASYLWIVPLIILEILFSMHVYFFLRSKY